MNDITIVDQVLAISGIVAETVCLACFLFKGAARVLPRFACYLAYTAIVDILGYLIYLYGNAQCYWYAYTTISLTGYVFELVVMWELVSQLTRTTRPEVALIARRIAFLLLVAFFAMATIMACLVSYRGVELLVATSLHSDLAFGVFRVLVYFAILALVQIRGIGWNEHHAQVAVCLSFYAVFSLFGEIAHEYAASMPYQYGGFAMIERARCGACCVTWLLLSCHMFTYRDRDSSNVRSVESVKYHDIKAF